MREIPFMKRLLVAFGQIPGVTVWRQNSGTILFRDAKTGKPRTFRAGVPAGAGDISGIVDPFGWRIEIEVKAEGGVVSEDQARWRANMQRAGAVYLTCAYDESRTVEQNVAAWQVALSQALLEKARVAKAMWTAVAEKEAYDGAIKICPKCCDLLPATTTRCEACNWPPRDVQTTTDPTT